MRQNIENSNKERAHTAVSYRLCSHQSSTQTRVICFSPLHSSLPLFLPLSASVQCSYIKFAFKEDGQPQSRWQTLRVSIFGHGNNYWPPRQRRLLTNTKQQVVTPHLMWNLMRKGNKIKLEIQVMNVRYQEWRMRYYRRAPVFSFIFNFIFKPTP